MSINWFDQGAAAYSQYRPEYPKALSEYLASIAPSRNLAADIGCGNGQLTRQLAGHFNQVADLDPSADQLAHAVPAANVTYQCAHAEHIPLPANSTSLISAAQAAHWFDLPAFYAQVRRIAEPGAVLALISYGVLSLDGELDERFKQFYWQEIGPYWPAERALVDSGYQTLEFPFQALSPPPLSIELDWDLPAFLGYVSTWSAVRKAREAGQQNLLSTFAEDLSGMWGDPSTKRPVNWPINMRLGRV